MNKEDNINVGKVEINQKLKFKKSKFKSSRLNTLTGLSLFRTIGVYLPISQSRDSVQVLACQGVTLVLGVTSEMMVRFTSFTSWYIFITFRSNTSFGGGPPGSLGCLGLTVPHAAGAAIPRTPVPTTQLPVWCLYTLYTQYVCTAWYSLGVWAAFLRTSNFNPSK